MSEPYPPPLDRLLTLGEPERNKDWADYSELGIGPDHRAELLRMAGDPQFDAMPPESPAVWAPVHAWRALGQLRAAEVLDPLLARLARVTDENWDETWDDTLARDFSRIAALIGPGILPRLSAFLADRERDHSARGIAAEAIKEIGLAHPETRIECVAILTGELEQAHQNDDGLNGFLISYLLDLKAAESGPVIESAFRRGLVDETVAGDWAWIRYQLGLGPKPAGRNQYGMITAPTGSHANPAQRAKARSKARRKEAKASKRKNRRK
jgi:hypothetical protein